MVVIVAAGEGIALVIGPPSGMDTVGGLARVGAENNRENEESGSDPGTELELPLGGTA